MKARKPKTVNGVTQDDAAAFGEVCVDGTRIPTRSVCGQFMAGDGVNCVARWWGICDTHVEDAIRYEMCRRSRAKVHAWARELHKRAKGY